MSAYDPHFLRRWFAPDADPDPAPESLAPALSPRQAERQRLVATIGEFLLAHDLVVDGFTLACAHDYLTQLDPRLVRAIRARLDAGEPITGDWLEQVLRDPEPEHAAVDRLIARVDSNLDEFGRTTIAARAAAGEYGSALQAHVGALAGDRAQFAELASLAGAMLQRTRTLERELAWSELHTRNLRRNLDQARQSAREDHLTGLPNRRAFDATFAEEAAAARAAGEPLAVAFCDIDRFKAVNDAHGHDAGDRVLRIVAQSLAAISDERCHVARHGGEEFVVLLRAVPLADAYARIDALREELAARHLVNRVTELPFGQVTFSAGIADVFAYATPREALRAADRALYRAKDEGRNRVLIADADRAGEESSDAA